MKKKRAFLWQVISLSFFDHMVLLMYSTFAQETSNYQSRFGLRFFCRYNKSDTALHNYQNFYKFPMQYCSYYQAHINRTECWYVTAILRSMEHMAFDRTIDTPNSILEFFVPEAREQEFLRLMHYFEQRQLVSDLKKLPNRLIGPGAQL